MIKAIQTKYRGYNFRSRLEARWAVFFDELDIEWQYEPEGFELPDGTRYLPDFHINQQGVYSIGKHTYGPWFEVKGTEPTSGEILKMQELCDSLSSYGFLVWGQPGDDNWVWIHKEGSLMESSASYSGDAYCGNSFQDVFLWRSMYKHVDFEGAVAAARSARFEFGESGATL